MRSNDTRLKLGNVSARLSFPRNSDRPSGNQQYVEITIRDEASHLEIIEVVIEPEDLIRLMGGAQAYGTARMLNAEHAARLGKELITGDPINIEGIPGYGKKPEHPAVLAAIEQARADGWESVDYRFSHGSHSLRVWRWGSE